MKKLRTIQGITDPYSRRILGNVVNKDPLTILKGTPRKLQRLMEGLTPKQLRTSPANGKWTITQLIAHFADTELVLGFRLRMAIAESGRPLQAIDQKKWDTGLGYGKADIRKRLELFTLLRQEHLRLLGSLPPAGWNKFGMHEERGKETVARMAQMYAGHDVNHLAQIEAIRRSFRRGAR